VTGPLNWVAASGARDLRSLRITLGGKPTPERPFTVRLCFVEPDGLAPRQRLFSVQLQGREVVRDLDIAHEAGGPNRSLLKEFRGVRVTGNLQLQLTPSPRAACGQTILCGVEVIEEPPRQR
jgi:hypothetical protein